MSKNNLYIASMSLEPDPENSSIHAFSINTLQVLFNTEINDSVGKDYKSFFLLHNQSYNLHCKFLNISTQEDTLPYNAFNDRDIIFLFCSPASISVLDKILKSISSQDTNYHHISKYIICVDEKKSVKYGNFSNYNTILLDNTELHDITKMHIVTNCLKHHINTKSRNNPSLFLNTNRLKMTCTNFSSLHSSEKLTWMVNNVATSEDKNKFTKMLLSAKYHQPRIPKPIIQEIIDRYLTNKLFSSHEERIINEKQLLTTKKDWECIGF